MNTRSIVSAIGGFFWKPFSAEASQKDVMTERFDPAKQAHVNYIQNEIAKFDNLYQSLSWTDTKLGLGSIALQLGATALNIGLFWDITFQAAFLSFLYVSQKRGQQFNAFQEQLEHLKSVYNWCAEKGVEVTADQSFLLLLKKIRPFIASVDELIKWNAAREIDRLSPEFKKLLAQAPHYFPFHHLNGQAENKPSYGIVDDVKSRMRLWLYGDHALETSIRKLSLIGVGQDVMQAGANMVSIKRH